MLLYPRAWRQRYGAELEELAGSAGLGLRDSIDLIRGAIDAHLHPELVDGSAAGSPAVSRQRLADLRVARRLGQGAWLGTALWIVGGVIAANGPIVTDSDGQYRDGGAGAPFFFGAVLLFAAGMIGQIIRLSAAARAARAGAIVALATAPVWALMPWVLPIGAVALAAIVVFALAGRRAGQWHLLPTIGVVAAALAGAAIVAATLIQGNGDRMATGATLLVAIMAFTPMWLILGATLQPLPPLAPGLDDANPPLAGGFIRA